MSQTKDERLPLVSVVVPALNCGAEVDGFLSSIWQQSYPQDRFEIIVADNGSSDDTVARLKASSINHVVRLERGRSRALNAGLQVARGDIVCTTDMSCRPERDWIRKIVECFEHPSVGCVAGEIHLLPTHSNLAMRFQARTKYMSPLYAASRTTLPFLPFADGANASFRRTVFDEIGPFDETFIKAADVEICYRMFAVTNYKIVFCRQAVVAETGEPTLAALLKQRFRIGIGSNLLEAKYPEFYRRGISGNALKRSYWKLARATQKLAQTLSNGRLPRKEDLEDAAVRMLMSWSQALGRHYGRWYLKRRNIRPTPLEPGKVRDFIANIGSLKERVVTR
jgi:cellulose synthase/poly-beta-1,6-N-acetylglucosamine synthase-like glycosyltransferase